jgi:hypothetical protein
MVGDRRQGHEAQLSLIRRDEQLDPTAHRSFFRDAFRKLLHEVALKIAERVLPVWIVGRCGSIEVVLINEPNENRLAAFSESQYEEWDGLRSRFGIWVQGADRKKFEQNVFGLDWFAQAFASRHLQAGRARG